MSDDRHPDGWPTPALPGWRPDDDRLRKVGIDPGRAPEVERWGEERFLAGPSVWPRPFFEVAKLRDFVGRFVDPAADVALVGVSLPAGEVANFLAQAGRQSATERLEAVRRGQPPEPGGQLVGYEVLGDGLQEVHSIVCTGAEVELHAELGLTLNERGLFATLEQAGRAAVQVSAGLGEPVTYFPWRVDVYSR